MKKHCLMVALLLFVVGVSLFLLQIWVPFLEAETLLKIEITLGGIAAIVIGVCFVTNEYRETQRIRNGNELDD